MKKSSHHRPDSDRSCHAPTQADGDLVRTSRTTSRRPASLSELEQDHLENGSKHAGHSNGNGNGNGNNNNRPGARRHGSSVSGGSPADPVAPAEAAAASLQAPWPGSVLEKDAQHAKTGQLSEKLGPAMQNPSFSHGTAPPELPMDPVATDAANGPSTLTPTRTLAEKAKVLARAFWFTTKKILLYSWLNVLLVFVPAGIIVGTIPDTKPVIVFSLNAIAIIPLAGLLSYATETVAHKMGDSIGALLNVTFGNAVEFIIFSALVKDEIRIVQASLLGSILSNLLLILGMGFFLGGLRYREQIYNSTVTQMSACLLSLSVISLVLPTAFHASFADSKMADRESLKISRGTSVILLLVYGIYLLFQLKSHAYMYVSTPQHIIDEEATPGPAAAWLDASSSDDSASSTSDSDSSGRSHSTMKRRMRRVIRGGRRRKSSVASLDTVESHLTGVTRTASFGDDGVLEAGLPTSPVTNPAATTSPVDDDTVDDDDASSRHPRRRAKRSLRRSRRHRKRGVIPEAEVVPSPVSAPFANPIIGGTLPGFDGATRRVDFAIADPALNGSSNVDQHGNPTGPAADLASARRAFNLRAMSLRPVAKSLAPTVFTQTAGTPVATTPAGPIPRVRYGIRRTNSLPDRLNLNLNANLNSNLNANMNAGLQTQQQQYALRPPGALFPARVPLSALNLDPATRTAAAHGNGGGGGGDDGDGGSGSEAWSMSRRAAILLLLVSTGLVAACAEFMVDSINGLVATSSVGEVFIGLIILPIVGNAAEHATAVTVAMKNKMDLAIGVAVGSSIQIALFMTPLVVILGWILGREMTLYFTLFETVCLFVSAFIVNFLVLDGRSNYLEGALLMSTYVIIGLAAYFYPDPEDASNWG